MRARRSLRGRVALWLALLAGCVACTPAVTPEQAFWSWFEAHAAKLRWVASHREDPLRDELAERLEAVAPGLDFEFTGEPGEPRELILSANSERALVPRVERLAAAAPPIEHWTVTALRPRVGSGFAIDHLGFVLEPDELWFTRIGTDVPVRLHVYATGIGEDRHRLAVDAARLLLQTALGERDFVTKVGDIELHGLPSNPAAVGLHPLSDLVTLIDALEAPP